MRPIHDGRLPLLTSPALALAATLPLLFLTGQPGPVALWGGLAALLAALPLAVPPHWLRPAVWTCAALATVLVVVASAPIGLFYSPVAVALPLSLLFTRVPVVRPGPGPGDPERNPARNPVRDRR